MQNGYSSKASDVLEARPSKIRKKLFDLQLPADDYIDTEEVGESKGVVGLAYETGNITKVAQLHYQEILKKTKIPAAASHQAPVMINGFIKLQELI
ncbi:hypothetical protein HAX54_033340 [Datura stramonium]|uniref:Uncharacterized protein n=1 Tax=Datura stramonium TaxID=4076 RepID=A0ABS8SDL7_DATST|nr:hypothetical protein [Datura stramonium]